MDAYIFSGYVVLLLPLIVAVVLIPACWLRDRLALGVQKPRGSSQAG